jgi:hypothetical protein
LFALLGCVNRGSHTDITSGAGGDAGGNGTGGQMMVTDASMDRGNEDTGVDAIDNCDIDGGSLDAGDAGPTDAGPPSSCTAMFNFESPAGCRLYGAMLGQDSNNPRNTDGFKRVYHTANASCGRGAMAIDVDLDGSSRLGGEVAIPINPTADYTGKTLSLAVKASVAGGSTVRFTVFLVTTRYEPKSIDVPLTTDYTKVSVVLPDMPDASAAGVIRISFQVHGQVMPYVGTVYVDEIDIHETTDAGSSDGPVDIAPTDARDGGSGDVRDGSAGS